MSPRVSPAVLSGRLRECDRQFPRPGSNPLPPAETVPWREFCDPEQPWLAGCIEEWQRRGGFRHHRAGVVLVAFRYGWLVCCATVPEYHLGGAPARLDTMSVGLGTSGNLARVIPTGETVAATARSWWQQVRSVFEPLCAGLHALGGPSPDNHQYWGNAVGLMGAVLWRMHRVGLPGDVLSTAHELRAATEAEGLLRLGDTARPWIRRTTCCQWWRSGANYCAECVLWDSAERTRERG